MEVKQCNLFVLASLNIEHLEEHGADYKDWHDELVLVVEHLLVVLYESLEEYRVKV